MSKDDWLSKQLQELEDDAFANVMDKATDRLAENYVPPKDGVIHVHDLRDALEEVRQDKGKFKGLSTGFTQLDAKMGGLEPGSVILIGGETSQGKSAVATNIAANVAQGSGVLYISLEMTLNQMLERLDAASDNPTGLNLMFQESFSLDYKDLEPLIKQAKQQKDIKLVVLDYLQYLGRGMTLDEVAKMSKTVKSLALRYNIAFVVIVSLRKGGADAKFRRLWKDISIEDLMGTSAIGYDADVAMVVSRKDPENNEWQPDKVYIKVLKTRNWHLDYRDPIVELEWQDTKITEKYKAPVNYGT